MKLSRRINLPLSVTVTLLAIGSILLLSLLAWVGLITHDRATYMAVGTITVTPVNNPSKYYTLKVGDINEAVKNDGVTDTIFVSNSANHWYSIVNHKEYEVSYAKWPNGQRVALYNVINGYLTGPGCIIPARKAKAYCATEKGKGYYVRIATVGIDIASLLNDQ